MTYINRRHVLVFGVDVPDISRRSADNFTNAQGAYTFTDIQAYNGFKIRRRVPSPGICMRITFRESTAARLTTARPRLPGYSSIAGLTHDRLGGTVRAQESLLRTAIFTAIILCVTIGTIRALGQKQPRKESSVEKRIFGKMEDGTEVELLTLKNARGTTVRIISYGASLQGLWVPDRTNKLGDVVLGFDDLKGYLGPHPG